MRPESTDAEWRSRAVEAGATFRRARLEEEKRHASEAARLGRRSSVCGALRLVLFALTAVLVVRIGKGAGASGVWLAAVAATGFIGVVLYHGRVRQAYERARRRSALARESAARLAGGSGPGAGASLGEPRGAGLDAGMVAYRDEDACHATAPWARVDLGIDGESPSLFEKLDVTSSELGARRLQRFVRHTLLDSNAIRARQHAVQALVDDRALRDDLALAYFACRDLRQGRLATFLGTPRLLPGGVLRGAVHAIGIATVPLVVLAFVNPSFFPGAASCLATAVAFHFAFLRRAALLRDLYLEFEPTIAVGLEIAPRLAARPRGDAVLDRLADVFASFTQGERSHRLRRIASQMRLLHLHEIGFLYGIIEILTLWDLHALLALESEVKKTPGAFAPLVGALADLEAHVALATWAAEQPGTSQPEILDGTEPRLEITAGEHPLLAFGAVVPNDLQLGGDRRLAIVTGSNMAGKSTFLRMVTLNTVLAQIGVPVRARSMRLGPLSLHANIHVRDSLADGKSTFLVEVERVQEIISAADASPRVLGVFDELFRGTNSRERLAASRAIARHLGVTRGLFLLATHDQELAGLALEEKNSGVFALHFRDAIEDGRMVFPYTAEPGVAASSNAIRLLEISGYPADIVREARREAGESPAKEA